MEDKPLDKQENEDQPCGSAGGLLVIQRRLTIACLSLVIGWLCLMAVQTFSDLLRMIAIAIFLTYTVIGLVDWLDSRLKSRILAVISVYLLGAVVALVGVVLIIPTLVIQLSQLVDVFIRELPAIMQKLASMIIPLEGQLARFDIHVKPTDLVSGITAGLPNIDGSLVFQQMGGVAVSTMTWLIYALSVLILSFYFLLDGSNMAGFMIRVLPAGVQPTARLMARDIHASMQAFFRGQIVLGLLFGLVMVVVYAVLGVEYGFALGLILGFWEVVPVIGPTIGFAPAFVSVLILGLANVPANRFVELLILVVVFNIFQWIKDNVVAPRYIGDAIGLHPVLIFVAIMIGARLDGILGIIVSLPVAGALGVLFRYLVDPGKDDAGAVEPDGPAVADGSAQTAIENGNQETDGGQ